MAECPNKSIKVASALMNLTINLLKMVQLTLGLDNFLLILFLEVELLSPIMLIRSLHYVHNGPNWFLVSNIKTPVIFVVSFLETRPDTDYKRSVLLDILITKQA